MHICELKSFVKPPLEVQLVMEALGILLGIKCYDWKVSKFLLKDPNQFLNMLMHFDKENIEESKLRLLEPYVYDRRLRAEKLSKINVAANSIFSWVKGMFKFGELALNLRPKKHRIESLNNEIRSLRKQI